MDIVSPNEIPIFELAFALFSDPEGHVVGLKRGGSMTKIISTDRITDDYMNERVALAKSFTVVVLGPTPQCSEPESLPISLEHGQRNMA